MDIQKENKTSLSGQTLIETLAAIFILVMGVTAATGLAIYAFNSSTSITKQIIATGLAREGVEAVKNMRDTNWLKQSSINTDCYNYETGLDDASCYKSWLNLVGGFNISDPPVVGMRLGIDGASAATSPIIWAYARTNSNWGLDFDNGANMGAASFNGFYKISDIGTGVANGSSEYYRQILLTEDSTGIYNHPEYHRLVVESRVWWTDKKCPRRTAWPGLGKCSISLVTNLTNWKNYQLSQ